MAIIFEFRRHSIKDGPGSGMIGPNGFALARKVGELQLRQKKFTNFFASTLWRTHQTLAAFDEGAGDFHLRSTPDNAKFYLDWPELDALWKVCANEAKLGHDMLQAALNHDLTLTRFAAHVVTHKFSEWVKEFPDNSHVLVVGHSPYMELIPMDLLGVMIPGLQECQGFRLSKEKNIFTLDWQSTDLDPSFLPK